MGKSTKKKPVIDSDGLEEDTAGEEASEEPIYHVGSYIFSSKGREVAA